MHKGLIEAVFAIALVSIAGAAHADVDAAQIKIAYSDGYTGADGQFHAWDHRSDAEGFRAKHADLYRPWRHDDPRHKDDH
jgi:hypothetical protein